MKLKNSTFINPVILKERSLQTISLHAFKTLKASTYLLIFVLILGLVVSCGSSSSGGPSGKPGTPPKQPALPFQNATSQSCATTRGAEALYWDYMNGIIRIDYPQTIKFLPYAPGIPFFHNQQPLYSFMYPSGWQAHALTDPSSQLTGANVIRDDSQAVWRRLNYTVVGAVTARDALDAEIRGMLAHLGNPQNVETVCLLESSDQTRAAAILRAGNSTANVSAQVFVSSFLGNPTTVIFGQVALAPTAQYEDTAVNVFFPLTGQLTPDGGSTDPECSDGRDNDGDGKTDYPADPGCSSREDDSESA